MARLTRAEQTAITERLSMPIDPVRRAFIAGLAGDLPEIEALAPALTPHVQPLPLWPEADQQVISRIGGLPWLPPGVPWPVGVPIFGPGDAPPQPLHFIAQLATFEWPRAGLPEIKHLPDGVFSIFALIDDDVSNFSTEYGRPGRAARVLFFPGRGEGLRPAEPPAQLVSDCAGAARLVPGRPIRFGTGISLNAAVIEALRGRMKLPADLPARAERLLDRRQTEDLLSAGIAAMVDTAALALPEAPMVIDALALITMTQLARGEGLLPETVDLLNRLLPLDPLTPLSALSAPGRPRLPETAPSVLPAAVSALLPANQGSYLRMLAGSANDASALPPLLNLLARVDGLGAGFISLRPLALHILAGGYGLPQARFSTPEQAAVLSADSYRSARVAGDVADDIHGPPLRPGKLLLLQLPTALCPGHPQADGELLFLIDALTARTGQVEGLEIRYNGA